MKHGKRKWITQGKKKVGKKERKKRWKGKIKNKWIYKRQVMGGKRREKDEKNRIKRKRDEGMGDPRKTKERRINNGKRNGRRK